MLQHNTTLTSLDFSANDDVNAEGLVDFFPHLATNKTLTSLNCSHLPVGMKAVATTLAEMLKVSGGRQG